MGMKGYRSSLRLALSRAIVLTSIWMILVAALFSGVRAYFEARELQDDLLEAIVTLVRSGQLVESGRLDDDVGDETLVIRRIDSQLDAGSHKELARLESGFQTRKIAGEFWRTSVQTHPASGERFMVAQQTAIRNDAAFTSALYGFVPALLVVVLMLLLIHIVVRRQFYRLDHLAEQLDAEGLSNAEALNDVDVPDEVRPFVTSISRLLQRNAEVLLRQQRFIADAAHELRSPIAALALQTDNLEKSTDEVDAKTRRQMVGRSVRRLQRLVSQLLDLARLQHVSSDSHTLASWRSIIRDVVSDRIALAEERKIDLGVSSVADVQVIDESEGLMRLLSNAVDNALRHTPEGGSVDIQLTERNGISMLIVEDTGSGIESDDLERVFEPFYRGGGGDSSSEKGEGTGLGLSICREIAARLGGEVTVENRAEGGLRFTYRQPVADVETAPSSE